jgi:ATP-dependent DNA helicase RecG
MRRLMDEAGFAPPTFESDRAGNRFITRLLLHHFLGPEDLRWLALFDDLGLSDAQRRGLIFLREAGALDNATYRQLNGTDTLGASQDLRRMRQAELIEKRGQSTATYYVPGARFVASQARATERPSDTVSTTAIQEAGGALTDSLGGVPEPLVHQLGGVLTALLHHLPAELQGRLPAPGTRRSEDELCGLILEVCTIRSWTVQELSELLGRDPKYLLRRHLARLVEEGELEHVHPGMPHHPRQAYRSRPRAA